MQSSASTVDIYCTQVPDHQKEPLLLLRKTILDHLPSGFEECMNYGMIGYVVPHSVYPAGYHCEPKLPLPFMGLAAQKNSINMYHMGLYADIELLHWFQDAYAKQVSTKLDMGKSCIRFKKYDQIPYALLGALAEKITVQQWIELYEKSLKR